MKMKTTILALTAFLMISMAAAESIDPPPLPGEDGDLDTEPEETDQDNLEGEPVDEETDTDRFDSDRVDQDRGVDETGEHSDGGVKPTGISGVISNISSFFSSLNPL